MSETTPDPIPEAQADVLATEAVQKAGDVAHEVLKQLTESLKPAQAEAGLIRFFPNGVELLHVTVNVALSAAANARVEVKLAGPKPPPAA